jgi:hypothetical protein
MRSQKLSDETHIYERLLSFELMHSSPFEHGFDRHGSTSLLCRFNCCCEFFVCLFVCLFYIFLFINANNNNVNINYNSCINSVYNTKKKKQINQSRKSKLKLYKSNSNQISN